jgi:hypothetical protein
MKGVSFLPGALVASGLIGVIVAAGALAFVGLNEPDRGMTALAATPLVLLFAVPVGFVVSIVPNLLGTALLATLGRDNIALRLPPIWALVGAGSGGTIAALLGSGPASAEPVALVAGIGAVSALLCRWKTAWIDVEPQKEASDGPVPTQPARAVARPRRHAADRWLD